MTQQRLLISLLIAAHLAADAAQANVYGDPGEWGVLYKGQIVGQIGMIALWTVFGRSAVLIRMLAAAAAIITASMLARSMDTSWHAASTCLIIVFAIAQSLAVALRLCGFQVDQLDSAHTTAARGQISIGMMLAIVTVWSIVAALVDPGNLLNDAMFLSVLFGAPICAAVALMLLILSRGCHSVRKLLVIAVWTLVSIWLVYLAWEPITGPLLWRFNLGSLMACAVSLWVARCCGWRFAWPQSANAKRSMAQVLPRAGRLQTGPLLQN